MQTWVNEMALLVLLGEDDGVFDEIETDILLLMLWLIWDDHLQTRSFRPISRVATPTITTPPPRTRAPKFHYTDDDLLSLMKICVGERRAMCEQCVFT